MQREKTQARRGAARAFAQQQGILRIVHMIRSQLRRKSVIVVAIAGSSGAGKGTIADAIAQKTSGINLSIDNYSFNKEKNPNRNYEILESIDVNLLRAQIQQLKSGRSVLSPVFDWATLSRKGTTRIKPTKVIVIEGVAALDRRILDLSDIRVYLQISKKRALERVLERDAKYYAREQIINYFNNTQDPSYRKSLYPSKRNANVVLTID